MDLMSKFQAIHRVTKAVFDPNTKGVMIQLFHEDKLLDAYTIGKSYQAKKIYQQFLTSFFTDKSKNAEELKHVFEVFALLTEDIWNKKHPEDPVKLLDLSNTSKEQLDNMDKPQ